MDVYVMRISRITACVIILLTVPTAFAWNTTSPPAAPLAGFEIGVQGAFGLDISSYHSRFNANNTNAGIGALGENIAFNDDISLSALGGIGDVGLSYLNFDSKITEIPKITNATPPVLNDNDIHNIGPILGFSTQYLINRRSSLIFSFDNYFYFNKGLSVLNNVNPGNYSVYSRIDKRRISFFIPMFSLGYAVNFAV